jgi:hypothetical protein
MDRDRFIASMRMTGDALEMLRVNFRSVEPSEPALRSSKQSKERFEAEPSVVATYVFFTLDLSDLWLTTTEHGSDKKRV